MGKPHAPQCTHCGSARCGQCYNSTAVPRVQPGLPHPCRTALAAPAAALGHAPEWRSAPSAPHPSPRSPSLAAPPSGQTSLPAPGEVVTQHSTAQHRERERESGEVFSHKSRAGTGAGPEQCRISHRPNGLSCTRSQLTRAAVYKAFTMMEDDHTLKRGRSLHRGAVVFILNAGNYDAPATYTLRLHVHAHTSCCFLRKVTICWCTASSMSRFFCSSSS